MTYLRQLWALPPPGLSFIMIPLKNNDKNEMNNNHEMFRLIYILGVLYDLTHREDEGLPWRLTIHFTKFPEDVLVKFSTKWVYIFDFVWCSFFLFPYILMNACIFGRDILESHFLSCLKEADVLKHRGQIISAMTKKDHNQLWLGLVNGRYSDLHN